MERMRVGLVVPMLPDRETQPSWAAVRRFALEAESAGFDSLWVIDDPMHRPGQRVDVLGVLGCIPTVGALCATTTSIDVGTFVANVHFRSPALLAKDADTLAMISEGRFILGVGAGDDHPQHEAMGVIWDGRFDAFEEALEIITTLLRTGTVDFVGDHYQARDAALVPRGPQPRGPKIMVGGRGPRSLRITAERADIWNGYFGLRGGEENLPEMLATLDRACEKIGRDPASLQRTAAIPVAIDNHPIVLESEVFPDAGVRGDVNQMADSIAAFAELGISEIQAQLWPLNLWALESFTKVLSAIRG